MVETVLEAQGMFHVNPLACSLAGVGEGGEEKVVLEGKAASLWDSKLAALER